MSGVVGKFEGIPIRLCKCGEEPEVSVNWNNISIYCLKCGHRIDVHIDPATAGWKPGFYDVKDAIEYWNEEMEDLQ